ncbi:protein PRRC1-like [Lutzomyia longipalpis]|uniref:protein PRRC1-like n=1 Tax=Lutzomyia longipalpis TaxID=7200 RepID=UPI0024837266|nr:protein PRRC1-like [Lutzomyia longipalpis]
MSDPSGNQGGNNVGNLLSNISPPSALPSNLILAPAAAPLISQEVPPVEPPTTQAAEGGPGGAGGAHIAPAFSPAIPPNKNTSTEQTPTDDGATQSTNLGHLNLNPEPVATALGPLTQSGSSLFGWMKDAASSGGGILSKVAEKAKNSVDTIVTTLDPQMKEYIYSGGDIEIIVASDKDDKVKPCREAFQTIFGKATVMGLQAQPNGIAAQPVGFEAALRGAQERTADLRTNSRIGDKLPIIAVENFTFEAFPDQWFDAGLLLLTDPLRNLTLKTVTQMTAIPLSIITAIKEDTPKDYQFLDTGFAVTVGQVMANNLGVHHTEWHKYYTGINRSDMILCAAKSLATAYKRSLGANIASSEES